MIPQFFCGDPLRMVMATMIDCAIGLRGGNAASEVERARDAEIHGILLVLAA